MTIEFEEIKVYNPGILLYSLSENIFSQLKEHVYKQEKLSNSRKKLISYSNQLIGQLEHQLDCNPLPVNVNSFILKCAESYSEYFYKLKNRYEIISVWTNLQKKGEYNPAHIHPNCNLSFVIWIKIPYLLADEDNLNNTVGSNDHHNGRLSIIYNTMFNNITAQNIELDKTYEGKMIIFPNTATHVVYPFYTSNEHRISVAGNLIERN